MEKINIDKETLIFDSGEKADCVYLIIDGKVGIYLPTNNTTSPDYTLGENEIFGDDYDDYIQRTAENIPTKGSMVKKNQILPLK